MNSIRDRGRCFRAGEGEELKQNGNSNKGKQPISDPDPPVDLEDLG